MDSDQMKVLKAKIALILIRINRPGYDINEAIEEIISMIEISLKGES